MSYEPYWERVRTLLMSRGAVKDIHESATNSKNALEKWEVPVAIGGKLLISFHPFAQSRAIYQCFDSIAGRRIVHENGFKSIGCNYKGLQFNPFSYKCNHLGAKASDLQVWESFILSVTKKEATAASHDDK